MILQHVPGIVNTMAQYLADTPVRDPGDLFVAMSTEYPGAMLNEVQAACYIAMGTLEQTDHIPAAHIYALGKFSGFLAFHDLGHCKGGSSAMTPMSDARERYDAIKEQAGRSLN